MSILVVIKESLQSFIMFIMDWVRSFFSWLEEAFGSQRLVRYHVKGIQRPHLKLWRLPDGSSLWPFTAYYRLWAVYFPQTLGSCGLLDTISIWALTEFLHSWNNPTGVKWSIRRIWLSKIKHLVVMTSQSQFVVTNVPRGKNRMKWWSDDFSYHYSTLFNIIAPGNRWILWTLVLCCHLKIDLIETDCMLNVSWLCKSSLAMGRTYVGVSMFEAVKSTAYCFCWYWASGECVYESQHTVYWFA